MSAAGAVKTSLMTQNEQALSIYARAIECPGVGRPQIFGKVARSSCSRLRCEGRAGIQTGTKYIGSHDEAESPVHSSKAWRIETAMQSPETAAEAVDELVGTFVRSVYSRSSVWTHTPIEAKFCESATGCDSHYVSCLRFTPRRKGREGSCPRFHNPKSTVLFHRDNNPKVGAVERT